jgi:hypothetical protein
MLPNSSVQEGLDLMLTLWRVSTMTFLALLALQAAAKAADFSCPDASVQFTRDLSADIDGKASTLLKIGSAEIKGTAKGAVVDLFSKYPHADRVAIINSLIYTTCSFIKNATQLTDGEKLDRWMAVYPAILLLMPNNQGDKKSEVPADILKKVTLGKTTTAYLTSVIGTPNFVEDYIASYRAGGYQVNARFCCKNPKTRDFAKDSILYIEIRIDPTRDDSQRDAILFEGSWSNFDPSTNPTMLSRSPRLGVTKLMNFQNGCYISRSDGGVLTNSDKTFVCGGGGTHADNWIIYEFLMDANAQHLQDKQQQKLNDLSTIDDWINGSTLVKEDEISQLLIREGISNGTAAFQKNSTTFNERYVSAMQPLVVTGVKLILDAGTNEELEEQP